MNHLEELHSFLDEFVGFLRKVEVSYSEGEHISLSIGVGEVVESIVALKESGGALIFVGNGGSAAIASHQSTDFIRTCGIRAFAPLDHSLLTCMANDCGYENVFAEPLRVLAKPEDILIAISSSGQSQNILNAVHVVKEKNCRVITLSGFKNDNPLRMRGDINFYVSSDSYRIVESAHLFICNWLLESTIQSIEQ